MNADLTSDALAGIRVVDLSQGFGGPAATMYLADLGADVIKIEPPGGDVARTLYTTPFLGSQSRPFLLFNRNKQSVVVDVQAAAGREVIYRLARRSDVVVTNYRPGTSERLGLDYDTLRSINPRLVYAQLLGLGAKGPDARKPAYDLTVQARAGVMASRRMPDGRPVSSPVMVADLSAPILLAYGVVTALLARERTGKGQKVETSLLGGAIAMQAYQFVRVARDPAQLPGGAYDLYTAYRCQDGEYIIFTSTGDKHWRDICAALGLDPLADDPMFSTFSKRVEHRDGLYTILQTTFATRSSAEWIERLETRNVPCAVVQRKQDVFDDPQVRQNDLIVDVDDPSVGSVTMMGIPVQLSDTPGRFRLPAPKLGQHTAEVLQGVGYTSKEIKALAQQGVIGLPGPG